MLDILSHRAIRIVSWFMGVCATQQLDSKQRGVCFVQILPHFTPMGNLNQRVVLRFHTVYSDVFGLLEMAYNR